MDLLNINIKSSLKYQVMFSFGAVMHISFLLLFFYSRVYPLAVINIFSVIIYFVGAFSSEKGNFERHCYGWIIALYTEITVHAVCCTVFLGCDEGFFMYSMMALPVATYTLFLSCREKFGFTIVIMAVTTAVTMSGSIFFVNRYGSVLETFMGRDIPQRSTEIMRSVNIFFNTGLIFFFSMLFVMEIHTLFRKLNDTNDRLAFTATHDALTGLYNRHSLRKFFDELENGNELFCIVMGDIDDFKKINDTYGHDCGDIVLKTVADIVMKNMGEKDIACRWGGEEFLIIMRGSREECFDRISLVKAQINALDIVHGNSRVHVTMTFGFADSDEKSQTEHSAHKSIDAMISTVDKRLYKGKTSGKNVIVV